MHLLLCLPAPEVGCRVERANIRVVRCGLRGSRAQGFVARGEGVAPSLAGVKVRLENARSLPVADSRPAVAHRRVGAPGKLGRNPAPLAAKGFHALADDAVLLRRPHGAPMAGACLAVFRRAVRIQVRPLQPVAMVSHCVSSSARQLRGHQIPLGAMSLHVFQNDAVLFLSPVPLPRHVRERGGRGSTLVHVQCLHTHHWMIRGEEARATNLRPTRARRDDRRLGRLCRGTQFAGLVIDTALGRKPIK